MVRRLIVVLTVISLLVVAGQAGATTEQAREEAMVLAVVAMANGYRVSDSYTTGYLAPHEETILKATLRANRPYEIIVGGCNDAYDVDIAVVDENRNVIGVDKDASKRAVVSVTPKWTGDFYIVVKMANSTLDGAHYCTILAYR
jgi:hypothetical protein